jgi:glycosyltransferase involved in cell wall biosynthesis
LAEALSAKNGWPALFESISMNTTTDSPSETNRPKVSVCIVTYKQEKYIRQCIESIINQVTNFDFEIIVGDDCSPDQTGQIVKELAEQYPTRIQALLHQKNLGPTTNYFSVHNIARGQYIAHLDGDDYALPGKLQALHDHLEANPDCAIVWHRMFILDEKDRMTIGMPITPVRVSYGKQKLYAADLALYYGLTGCHSGSMYRHSKKTLSTAPEGTIDYYMTMSFCITGSCAMYIEDALGVYRFIATDNTITRAKGSIITGRAKLNLIKYYKASNPELKKYFAAQCVFEILYRTYLKYPLVNEYIRLLFELKTIPSPRSVFKVLHVFMKNRGKALQAALKSSSPL